MSAVGVGVDGELDLPHVYHPWTRLLFLFKCCSHLTFYLLSSISSPNINSFVVLATRALFSWVVLFSAFSICSLGPSCFFLLVRHLGEVCVRRWMGTRKAK